MAKHPTTRSSKGSKKTTAKTAGKASSTQTRAKRETLVSLRAHVDRVEARLKRADALTRKSVKAIETAYDALSISTLNAQQTQQDTENSTAQKSALNQHVGQLTHQLSQMVTDTRRSVNAELKRAISNPNLEQLKTALQIADDRIAETDTKLAHAIANINRHIADMALAVDARLKTEKTERTQAIEGLRSETEKARYALIQRLERIETESANAIRTIGDKVSETTEAIKKSTEEHTAQLKTDLTQNLSKTFETAQKDYKTEVQADLEALRQELKARIEKLETEKTETLTQRDRNFASLETRLEGLEHGLNTALESVKQESLQEKGERVDIDAAFDTQNTHDPVLEATSPSTDHTVSKSLGGKVSYLPAATPFQTTQSPVTPSTVTTAHQDSFNQDHATLLEPVDALDVHPALSDPALSDLAQNDLAQNDLVKNDLTLNTETIPENPYSHPLEQAATGTNGHQAAYGNPHEGIQVPIQEPIHKPTFGQASSAPISPYNMQAETIQVDNIQAMHPPFVAPEALEQHHAVSMDDIPLPYENPAYADPNYNLQNNGQQNQQNNTLEAYPSEVSMMGSRPGNFETPKSKLLNFKRPGSKSKSSKLPKLRLQNKRTIAFAAGITAIGLVSIKLLTSGAETTQSASNSGLNEPSITITSEPGTQGLDTGVDSVGQASNFDPNQPNKGMASTQFTDMGDAAKAGDPIAQFQLGLSYLQNGRTEEALPLIRSAADNGLAAAQYRLAKLYEVGEGVQEDEITARRLTERAARSGNRIAMHDLALYYAEGRGGLDLDMVTAAKWFEKAAERGVVDSQFNLGVLFESGQGLPQNLTDAFVWYSIAAKQGDQLAAQRIEVLSTQIDGTFKATASRRIANFKPALIDKKANGIFENLPWATTPNAVKMDKKVKVAQDLLNNLGYNTGTPDGAMGPKTRSAIISFEKSNNLPETGRVSNELIDRLSLAAGA